MKVKRSAEAPYLSLEMSQFCVETRNADAIVWHVAAETGTSIVGQPWRV